MKKIKTIESEMFDMEIYQLNRDDVSKQFNQGYIDKLSIKHYSFLEQNFSMYAAKKTDENFFRSIDNMKTTIILDKKHIDELYDFHKLITEEEQEILDKSRGYNNKKWICFTECISEIQRLHCENLNPRDISINQNIILEKYYGINNDNLLDLLKDECERRLILGWLIRDKGIRNIIVNLEENATLFLTNETFRTEHYSFYKKNKRLIDIISRLGMSLLENKLIKFSPLIKIDSSKIEIKSYYTAQSAVDTGYVLLLNILKAKRNEDFIYSY